MILGDVIYENKGKTRDKSLSSDLETILKETAKLYGYDIKVTSGGQTKDKRTGSDRHDDGHAGDLQLMKDGKVVDIESNKSSVAPFFSELVKRGVTSIGYSPDYMGTSTFHADNAINHGKGVAGVRYWGKGGKSANAPDWLRSAVDAGYNSPNRQATGATQATAKTATPDYPSPMAKPNNAVPIQALWETGQNAPNRKFTSMDRLSGADLNSNPVALKGTEIGTEKTIQTNKQGLTLKGSGADAIPYLSNMYNAFQKPAPVPQPVYNSPIQLDRVNLDNDRYEANKDYRATGLNADRTLDGNSSVAVKAFAKAQKFKDMSTINQTERNENVAIANKERGINVSIAQDNNAMLYNYRTLGSERENAIRTQQSANIANATDKFTNQQTVKNQYALEDRKLGILENTDQYSTYARLQAKLDAEEKTKKEAEEKAKKGIQTLKMGGSLGKYTAGAFMKKLKTVY